MGLLDFLAWAARTGNPVRSSDGTLMAWNSDTGGFEEIESSGMDSLWLGEVGDDNVSIRESVTTLRQELTANGVSNIHFEVFDPGLKMHSLGNFVLDRTVNFNGWFYKITSITVNHSQVDIVRVDAEPANVVALKNDKGAANFGSISPTTFAAQKAAEFGMTFFGESSPIDGNIVRRFDDKTDESTWDVLRRLANSLKFSMFEGNNTLFFASDEYIIEKQPVISVNVPSGPDDDLFATTVNTRRSVSKEYSAQADFKFVRNTTSASLFPGVCLNTVGMGPVDDHTFMVANVHFSLRKGGTVNVTTRSTKDPSDAFCTKQTVSPGAKGYCVLRVQKALGMKPTGIYDAQTEQKVKEFQAAHNIAQTGEVGPITWDAIEANT